MRSSDERLQELERTVAELRSRVDRLEQRGPVGLAPRRGADEPPKPAAASAAPSKPRPEAPSLDLEELLGGRVLAWIGGAAIALGVVFFLGMAISRGWIGEAARTILAAGGSTLLLAAGVWLYERRGQTEAALAAVAAALAGLYATITVATQVYALVSPAVGLVCAALVGAAGAAIAIRWRAMLVGGIGLVGAVLAPVLTDAGTTTGTLAFMALALTASVAVLVWQRWNWFAAAIFVVSAPQLLAWIEVTYRDRLALALGALVAFWALYVVAALGYELRARTGTGLPVASWLLLFANVLLVAGTGYFVLHQTGHADAGTAWVLAFSLAHIALGAWSLRSGVTPEVGLLLVAVGLGLSAIGFALALSGPALVAGWAAHAVLLAYAAQRLGSQRALVGALAFLGLALAHVLVFEAPLSALRRGVDELGVALVAIATVAAAAGGVAWLNRRREDGLPLTLAALAGGLVVYAGSVAIVDVLGVTAAGAPQQTGQVLLSTFWALTGLAVLVAGLVRDARPLRVGGLALLALAIVKVALYDLAELDEIYRVLSFIALGLLLLAGAFAYQRMRASAR